MQGICDMVSFCFEPSPDPDSDLDFDPAPDLALAPVLDYFPVHVHDFTFDSTPRLLM